MRKQQRDFFFYTGLLDTLGFASWTSFFYSVRYLKNCNGWAASSSCAVLSFLVQGTSLCNGCQWHWHSRSKGQVRKMRSAKQ